LLAIIRVFTTKDPVVLGAHGQIIEQYYKLSTRTYCIPDQQQGIYDQQSEMTAAPKIVTAATRAAAEGAQAIFISCAADPAVEECRRALSVPVIGAGSAAAATALALGKRIGVLNLNAATLPAIADILWKRLTSESWPQGVNNTTDLLTPAGRQAAISAAQDLAEKCDVIVLGCTGYSTVKLAKTLRGVVNVPVVDAVEAGGALAMQILRPV
jgi:Asp/Glu/hydantoin racemase